jgi:hypothetical protein
LSAPILASLANMARRAETAAQGGSKIVVATNIDLVNL